MTDNAVRRGSWALCPVWQVKLARVEEDGSGSVLLWCKRCRCEHRLELMREEPLRADEEDD